MPLRRQRQQAVLRRLACAYWLSIILSAAFWYERAIAYLPAFVKARVHLSEIHLSEGEADEAACALRPALRSGDPEVSWRLAEALKLQSKVEEAETLVAAARRRFEELLEKHPLAFADHAAEFYAANGDHHRAFALAQLNVANRPMPRAIARLEAIAAGSG